MWQKAPWSRLMSKSLWQPISRCISIEELCNLGVMSFLNGFITQHVWQYQLNDFMHDWRRSLCTLESNCVRYRPQPPWQWSTRHLTPNFSRYISLLVTSRLDSMYKAFNLTILVFNMRLVVGLSSSFSGPWGPHIVYLHLPWKYWYIFCHQFSLSPTTDCGRCQCGFQAGYQRNHVGVPARGLIRIGDLGQ